MSEANTSHEVPVTEGTKHRRYPSPKVPVTAGTLLAEGEQRVASLALVVVEI